MSSQQLVPLCCEVALGSLEISPDWVLGWVRSNWSSAGCKALQLCIALARTGARRGHDNQVSWKGTGYMSPPPGTRFSFKTTRKRSRKSRQKEEKAPVFLRGTSASFSCWSLKVRFASLSGLGSSMSFSLGPHSEQICRTSHWHPRRRPADLSVKHLLLHVPRFPSFLPSLSGVYYGS